VTLINTWGQLAGDGRHEERYALVECDGCLPPNGMVGTQAEMSALGWDVENLDAGPHFCPWCAPRSKRRQPHRRWSPPVKRPALPNLLIIGASKCGTTSLHRYLALHPQVYMSRSKEMRFFLNPNCLDRLDIYATFFEHDAQVRGESSPLYTCHPIAPGVPERIRAAIPDVRLIYLVRDPVDRTVADYVQERGQDRERRSFQDAVGEVEDPYNRYVAGSRYAMQLERYASHFPLDQLLVVDQDELLNRRRETLRDVFRFLDVDAGFVSARFEELWNTRETKIRWTRIGRSLVRSRLADTLRLLPSRPRQALFRPVKRLTTSRLGSPILEPTLRRRLQDVYREDVSRLRDLTGKEFAGWQI
jgi:Sulfotransferase domain